MNAIEHIRQGLATWYERHKRDLPWRSTKDPYAIWISEIILQQTRVDQGLDYYYRFLERFPNVRSLAEAEEDEVLKLWQGLGYYSRARNLHKAARQILQEYRGVFPSDHKSILDLKGVGPYTAAAVASFAFDIPAAAVDGNVSRVISRLFAVKDPINKGPGIRSIELLANELLNQQNPAQHNQAIMEFGALQCVPSSPQCAICPLAEVCEARLQDVVSELPIKIKNIKRRNRYFHYLIVLEKDKIALQQRGEKDIWQGLYEFPLIEKEDAAPLDENDLKGFGLDNVTISSSNSVSKHVLSHQDIHATFHHIKLNNQPKSLRLERIIDLEKFALPRLIDRYLHSHNLKTGEKIEYD